MSYTEFRITCWSQTLSVLILSDAHHPPCWTHHPEFSVWQSRLSWSTQETEQFWHGYPPPSCCTISGLYTLKLATRTWASAPILALGVLNGSSSASWYLATDFSSLQMTRPNDRNYSIDLHFGFLHVGHGLTYVFAVQQPHHFHHPPLTGHPWCTHMFPNEWGNIWDIYCLGLPAFAAVSISILLKPSPTLLCFRWWFGFVLYRRSSTCQTALLFSLLTNLPIRYSVKPKVTTIDSIVDHPRSHCI